MSVTIVLPCYNAERYLEETLVSIDQQTYLHWKLVAVDDASTDRTASILDRWQERLGKEKMQILRQPENRGLGTARNTGIALANTEFIAFIDSDDLWTPDHLEAALHALSDTKYKVEDETMQKNSSTSGVVDLVFSPTISFWDDPDRGRIYKRLENPGRFPEDLHKELFLRCFTVPAAAVFRKKIWEVAGPFHTNRRIEGTEDHHFWMSVFEHGFQVLMIEEGAIYYRRHDENMTGGKQSSLTAAWKKLRSRWKLIHYRSIPLWLRLAALLQTVKLLGFALFGYKTNDFWEEERKQAQASSANRF